MSVWRTITLAGLALMASCTVDVGGTVPVRSLAIIAGQSNAVGGASSDDLTDQRWVTSFPPVQIMRHLGCDDFAVACTIEDTWTALAPHAALAAPTGPRKFFGVELSLGRELAKGRPADTVYILQHATNGTTLHTDWDPDAVDGLRLYSRLIDQAQTQSEAIGAPADVMYWIQGNGDANTLENAEAYAERLVNFINRVRIDLDNPDLLFVYDQLSPINTVNEFLAELRAAQALVSITVPNVRMIHTEGLALRDAEQHYSADAFIDLGLRMGGASRRPGSMGATIGW